jgi:hypothetical protein
MRDFRDAKAMAQTLRDTLKTKSVSLSHSESLAPMLQMLWSPGIERMQQILETADVMRRLTMILETMKMDRQAA